MLPGTLELVTRHWLYIWITILSACACQPQLGLQTSDSYGIAGNDTGDTIGGGMDYSCSIARGNRQVNNLEALLTSLEIAGYGDTIFIPSGITLDLTGQSEILLPKGLTLAGDRGLDGRPGPLLFTDELPYKGILFLVDEDVHVSGLRIRGPDPEFAGINYDIKDRSAQRTVTSAMATRGRGVEIDNCEISNFDRGGIEVQFGSRDIHIHHNYIHDIAMYPVVVLHRSEPPVLIEANLIEWIWHAVAGSGYAGSGYEARYNQFVRKKVPKAWEPYGGGHAVDMHPYLDLKKATGIRRAGRSISVHHNTFQNDAGPGDASAAASEDVYIRGVPEDIALLYNNQFLNENPAQAVKHYDGNVWIYNNQYGEGGKIIGLSGETRAKIELKLLAEKTEDLVQVLDKDEIEAEVAVDLLPGLRATSICVELDGREVLRSRRKLKPSIALDPGMLDPDLDLHELRIVVTDDRGTVSTKKVVFKLP